MALAIAFTSIAPSSVAPSSVAPSSVVRDDRPVGRPDLHVVDARGARRRPAADRSATVGTGRRSVGTGRPSAATYRRRRTVALGLVAAAVVALWVGIHGLAGAPAQLPPTETIAQRIVVVRPGDTLWSIALASGVRGDIRPVVDALSAEVHGQPLQVGEELLLP